MSLKFAAKNIVHALGMAYVKWLCRREYKCQVPIDFNERPIEFAFLFRHLSRAWPKNVLDVGTGMTALPHLIRNCGFFVTAIDNVRDYWSAGMVNRHYHILDDDITDSRLLPGFDFISCISVLEHIHQHTRAVASMVNLLSPGGLLLLTFPYNEKSYVENVYLLPESSVGKKYPFITQAFSRSEVQGWLEENRLEVVEQEYWEFFGGDYWTCGSRLQVPKQVSCDERHQHCCLLLKKAL